MNRFQCVADHQRRYGVKRLCSILGVSPSSFYYWRRTAANQAARQAADAGLAARIRSHLIWCVNIGFRMLRRASDVEAGSYSTSDYTDRPRGPLR